jgi:hypothetical protein
MWMGTCPGMPWVGPTWCWAPTAVLVTSIHAPANHGREGSLRDGGNRALLGPEALPSQIGCDKASTGSTWALGAARTDCSPAAQEEA